MRWLQVLWAVTTLLLAVSATLNFALFAGVQKYYWEVNATRLDPLGLTAYPQKLSVSETSDDIRVVIFGDSRAAGWDLPATEGYDFINRGIASQTSAQVLQRFAAHVVPLDPDIIVVQVGINDLKTIGLFPAQTEDIVSAYQANIVSLVALAQEETEATVVVGTILPAGDVTLARRLVWSDAIDQAVVEMNDYLKTVSNGQDVLIFDGFALIAEATTESGRSDYYKDELHFTQLGYDLLNEPLMALLRSLPPANVTSADETSFIGEE